MHNCTFYPQNEIYSFIIAKTVRYIISISLSIYKNITMERKNKKSLHGKIYKCVESVQLCNYRKKGPKNSLHIYLKAVFIIAHTCNYNAISAIIE